MVVAFGNLETVMQWVSDGWAPNTWCDFRANRFSQSSSKFFNVGRSVETAYGTALKAGRQDVIEYFESLGVDLIHSETVKAPLHSVGATVNYDTPSDL
jgi:hypothetical protein